MSNRNDNEFDAVAWLNDLDVNLSPSRADGAATYDFEDFFTDMDHRNLEPTSLRTSPLTIDATAMQTSPSRRSNSESTSPKTSIKMAANAVKCSPSRRKESVSVFLKPSSFQLQTTDQMLAALGPDLNVLSSSHQTRQCEGEVTEVAMSSAAIHTANKMSLHSTNQIDLTGTLLTKGVDISQLGKTSSFQSPKSFGDTWFGTALEFVPTLTSTQGIGDFQPDLSFMGGSPVALPGGASPQVAFESVGNQQLMNNQLGVNTQQFMPPSFQHLGLQHHLQMPLQGASSLQYQQPNPLLMPAGFNSTMHTTEYGLMAPSNYIPSDYLVGNAQIPSSCQAPIIPQPIAHANSASSPENTTDSANSSPGQLAPRQVQRATPRKNPEYPHVYLGSHKQPTMRTGKIQAFDAKKPYKDAPAPYPSWKPIWSDGRRGQPFKYLHNGELSEHLYKPSRIRDYLVHHESQRTFSSDGEMKKLTLWIQKAPSDSARRYYTTHSSKCRFANCPATNRTIYAGHYRVVFDEKHLFQEDASSLDPFVFAGCVHLYCMERFLDFPFICSLPHIKVQAESRQLPLEIDGRNRMELGGLDLVAASKFLKWVHKCIDKFFGRYPSYPLPEKVGGKWVPGKQHLGTLNFAMQSVVNPKRPMAARPKFALHMGDLDLFEDALGNSRKIAKIKSEELYDARVDALNERIKMKASTSAHEDAPFGGKGKMKRVTDCDEQDVPVERSTRQRTGESETKETSALAMKSSIGMSPRALRTLRFTEETFQPQACTGADLGNHSAGSSARPSDNSLKHGLEDEVNQVSSKRVRNA
jgi:hypothetical protein